MKAKIKYKAEVTLTGKDMNEIGAKWKELSYENAEVTELVILEP